MVGRMAKRRARIQRADFLQVPNQLIPMQIGWKLKIAGNAYTPPFEAKVGRKMIGRTPDPSIVAAAAQGLPHPKQEASAK